MSKQIFSNNATTTIYGSLAQGGTTLVLAQGTGAYFPGPAEGEFFLGTLYEKDTAGLEIRLEIVKVTARVADTLTIERDFEDLVGESGGYAYPSEVGKTVYFDLRWTAYAANNSLQSTANLSDLSDVATARINLNIDHLDNTADADKPVSTAQAAADTATLNAAKADATTKANAAQAAAIAASTPVAHATNTSNPHGVTKAQVGLGNCDNTSDLNKPISTATQAALAGKSPTTHNHSGVYEPVDATLIREADIGTKVQAFDADLSSWVGIDPSAKQDALVSGTNIKTLNGVPLLGSGDILLGMIRVERTSNVAIDVSASGSLIDITSGTFTQTFASCATLGSGFYCYVRNSGTEEITLDPAAAETIDGVASFIMYPGELRLIQCDGTTLRSVVLNAFKKIFTASGTFYPPPGYKKISGLLWGGGGGGGAFKGTGGVATGGGGGACCAFSMKATQLAASVSVVIGAGGTTTATSGSATGGTGGTSSFGTYVTAYGGGGGNGGTTALGGGSGGGVLGAGAVGATTSVAGGAPSSTSPTGGFGGGYGIPSAAGGAAVYGGGGGGGGTTSAIYTGGNSVFGGGGGAAARYNATTPGGASAVGGSGGASVTNGSLYTAAAGVAPGGGGGACASNSSNAQGGPGGNGQLIIFGEI